MQGETPTRELWVGVDKARSGFGSCNLTVLWKLDPRDNESKQERDKRL